MEFPSSSSSRDGAAAAAAANKSRRASEGGRNSNNFLSLAGKLLCATRLRNKHKKWFNCRLCHFSASAVLRLLFFADKSSCNSHALTCLSIVVAAGRAQRRPAARRQRANC